jgi:hypothetical protein
MVECRLGTSEQRRITAAMDPSVAGSTARKDRTVGAQPCGRERLGPPQSASLPYTCNTAASPVSSNMSEPIKALV